MGHATARREIESIKQLKARYCRYLDTKDWDSWRGIFIADFPVTDRMARPMVR